MDWQAEYDQLRAELSSYSAELAAKPHCVVLTKTDLLGDTEPPEIHAPDAFATFVISAVARTRLDRMLDAWWHAVQAVVNPAPDPGEALAP
jgi:GTPase